MKRLVLAALLASPVPALAQATVTLSVTFSEKAMAELKGRNEGITIGAYWNGDPAPGATMATNEIGSIDLLQETYTFPAREVTVTLGANLAAAPLDQVVEPMLLVNVYSAFWSAEDNLLDCGLVQDTLSNLSAPQAVTCKLIGE